MRSMFRVTLLLVLPLPAFAQPNLSLDQMEGTQPLVMDEPLDVVMVRGINYFAERELADSPNRRAAKWKRNYSSREAYEKSVEPNRQRLREIIGAVDERVAQPELYTPLTVGAARSELMPLPAVPVSWAALNGVTGVGTLIEPAGPVTATPSGLGVRANVILIPDPDGGSALFPHSSDAGRPVLPGTLAEQLADAGCRILIPALLDRSDGHSGHPDVRFTNQPHREFIYRMAFEMGRHVVGYEVQKVLAAVDSFESGRAPFSGGVPTVVAGAGEGGLIALYAAALDPRIDAVVVSGYFQEREAVWREPIYRNIWSQLPEFGDAEIASLIAPRPLIIEACAVPEVSGPPAPREGRGGGAAPGRIVTADVESVRREFTRAREHYDRLGSDDNIKLVISADGTGPAFSAEAGQELLSVLGLESPKRGRGVALVDSTAAERVQQQQVDELNRFTQRLMHSSDKYRDKVWSKVDRSSVEACVASLEPYREWVYDALIGRLPEPTIPLNPRTRKVIDEPTHVGYEVVLDLFRPGESERPFPQADGSGVGPVAVDKDFFAVGEDWGVIAGGILLIPRNLKPGERRPVVVCQHGLEGTPMSTITTDPSERDWNYYKGFTTELCRRGFITYAPQNPYRGQDAFRQIQRKSNPMGRSLFSYIIPQHQRTLEWLASLPYVDAQRIAFYGLSYGGKTAVRVPPLLPQPRSQGSGARFQSLSDADLATESRIPNREFSPGYCLSICSADFDDWIRKNASSEDRYSYVFTGEYEIFEWNMGHVANYAELSYLMTPRPFMVERGHDDGVAPDEWVAWEFAKVKRHYDKLEIGDRAEMEVFDGPHTINGVGTYEFLHRHLDWPQRTE